MSDRLTQFLATSYTAYHAAENAEELLLKNGFVRLNETDDWTISEGGKYFVVRNGSAIVAFTVGALDQFAFRIVASHTDSPALKLKENAVTMNGPYARLNAEKYGGGIWYSFFDRPLKIAGRLVVREDGVIRSETAESDFFVTVPSLAVHMNRGVNDGFSVNAQTDLQPLLSLSPEGAPDFPALLSDKEILAYDLYLVNAEAPYSFGINGEFLASPRIDNLTSVCASLEALTSHGESGGICVAACLDNEEVGSRTMQGAGGDFLENVLRRIAYALKFDDNEYYKALAASFLISLDNAHAMHPNHPDSARRGRGHQGPRGQGLHDGRDVLRRRQSALRPRGRKISDLLQPLGYAQRRNARRDLFRARRRAQRRPGSCTARHALRLRMLCQGGLRRTHRRTDRLLLLRHPLHGRGNRTEIKPAYGFRKSAVRPPFAALFSRRSLFRTNIFQGPLPSAFPLRSFPCDLSGPPAVSSFSAAATGSVCFRPPCFIVSRSRFIVSRCALRLVSQDSQFFTQRKKPIERWAFLFISFGDCRFIAAPFYRRADLSRPLI